MSDVGGTNDNGSHPDPAMVIANALDRALADYELPAGRRAQAVLDIIGALREGACLRETPPDWPELPPGSHILTDLRIIEWLEADSGDPKVKLRYADDMRWTSMFAMLGTATAEITHLWAQR